MPCEALFRRTVHTVLSLHNYDECHSNPVFDKGPPSVGKVHVCGFEQEPVQGLAPLMEAGFKVLHSQDHIAFALPSRVHSVRASSSTLSKCMQVTIQNALVRRGLLLLTTDVLRVLGGKARRRHPVLCHVICQVKCGSHQHCRND